MRDIQRPFEHGISTPCPDLLKLHAVFAWVLNLCEAVEAYWTYSSWRRECCMLEGRWFKPFKSSVGLSAVTRTDRLYGTRHRTGRSLTSGTKCKLWIWRNMELLTRSKPKTSYQCCHHLIWSCRPVITIPQTSHNVADIRSWNNSVSAFEYEDETRGIVVYQISKVAK